MKKVYLYAFLCFLAACSLSEENISENPKALTFSTDTVFFDTVFTEVKNFTKRLRIRNPNDNAVRIDKISLANANTPYSLTINGEKVQEKKDLIILGKDSILVLITVKLDANDKNLPFIVEDSLLVSLKNNQQKVHLLSWGQNAHFLNDVVIKKNTTWKNDKPYVIFNGISVDSLVKLNIEAGTQIYLSNESDFYVKGTLTMQGTAEKPILVAGTRLDDDYKRAFGQWGGIYFLEGSKNNLIEFAHIKNGTFGLRVGTPDPDNIPDLVVRNTIVENMSAYGLAAFTSDVLAENCLFYNCIQGTAWCVLGGNYVFRHCNFINLNEFFRESPAFTLANFIKISDNNIMTAPLKASLENCIVWGSLKEEIQLASLSQSSFELALSNNLFKTEQSIFPKNTILNQDPKFVKPDKQNFRLDKTSPAVGKGKTDLGIKIDLEGKTRKNPPDIGAYESQ